MMRKSLLFLLPIAALLSTTSISGLSAQSKVEKRCGWFQNPTPANAWLSDRDGLWLISSQGGYQAQGDWPPEFPPNQWIRTNVGSYGYGCACFDVTVDRSTNPKRIVEIKSAQAQALKVCRTDPNLREPG
ncbi:DUF4087 domain-containing protein [Pseudanabaena sp. PCC 6802]|uniref:DUF4087 domain-containing protein n=1 Tax=Pseudanabaena sp. PCC 6802 TaxID=118173 RepID=UPI000562BFE5|nr:DUF4087 domain-containing protein [Pseudanabaena sp. PCC 6802]